ncbi:MAG: CapA family protein [Streptosporangiales bacterium]|nr:CapA family protein [Streptosporangiales bacterium]
MRASRAVIAMSGLLIAVTACSVPEERATAARSTPPPPSPSATPTPTPTTRPYTISFGGDVHFEGFLRQRLSNPSKGIGTIGAALRRSDIAMVNLETAITTGGDKAPGKEFAFRAPSTAFDTLEASGVDVASMANNHGMDYMESGLADSLAAIKRKRFPVVGIGKDEASAYKPWYTKAGGQRVAIIGATQVMDEHLIPSWTASGEKGGLASAKNEARLIQEVKRARERAHTVIVHLHWGEELNKCPLPRQQSLAKALARAGADVIVGGHAHIPLAGGYAYGAYVHYGLGNFVFYSGSGPTTASGVLTLRIHGRKVLRAAWRPARISGGVPVLLKGEARTQELARWKSLRSCAPELSDNP